VPVLKLGDDGRAKLKSALSELVKTNPDIRARVEEIGKIRLASMQQLMQMAKVSAALARHDRAGGLFISVLTNPTMGGVAASFASLGDVIFAEPKALIGFAGPRTIRETIRIELPKGFQTSEFLLEHGYIDRIVPRDKLKSEIARVIDYCGK